MTHKKKFAAWCRIIILLLPAALVFNTNPDAPILNAIGVAYIILALRYVNRIVPRWIRDYIRETSVDDSPEI